MPFTSITHEGLTLLCFPAYDQGLSRLALRALRSLDVRDPDELQERLRAVYPRVVVRRREPIATDDPTSTWYLYRDGRYSPFVDDEPWWTDPAVARLVLSDDGRYIDGSAGALALLGVTRRELRTARSGDFTAPAARTDGPGVIALLRLAGSLHSTTVVEPRGGRGPIGVEYRMAWDGAGPGHHVVLLREVPLEAVAPDPVTLAEHGLAAAPI